MSVDQLMMQDGLHDVFIADLPDALIKSINARLSFSWFTAVEFCRYVGFPSNTTDRIFVWVINGEITKYFCYQAKKILGRTSLHGYTDPAILQTLDPTDFVTMLQLKKAASIVIHLAKPDALSSLSERTIPHFTMKSSAEPVIKLPADIKSYLESLGNKTRKHLPYYLRRLQKQYGETLSFECIGKNDVTLDLFRQVVNLSRLRMAKKGVRHGYTEDTIQRWMHILTGHGMICSLHLHGIMIAATVNIIYKGEAYLESIGHDPQFDKLNLGNTMLYLTISHLINSGIPLYHLLWGNQPYKAQFGGQLQQYYDFYICKDVIEQMRWQIVLLGRRVISSAYYRSSRLWCMIISQSPIAKNNVPKSPDKEDNP